MTSSVAHVEYSLITRALLKTYAVIKRSGALETPLSKRCFQEVYFLYKRFLEDPYDRFCQRYPELFTGDVVLDIGANCGYTASVFAKAARGSSHVYAFEPDPTNVEILEAVLARK